MSHIKTLKELGKNDAPIAGGKGASLGEMTSAGIPVPPGFVVLSSAFDRFVEETGTDAEIDAILDKVDYEEMHTIENASEEIQALILGAEMPTDLGSEITLNFKKLGAKFVAVRSSATSEDSASAAWAGQLDSYLNTTSETLLENVKKCWASLFTPRAIFYRKEKNLHNQKISVAVVVQKMVDSEASGIAFSVHPVTQSENQAIIEAGFGLGEAIVSGQITPDSYVIEKEPRRIIDKNVHVQSRGLYRRTEGGNEWRTLPEKEGSRQVLNDEEIFELTSLVLLIERHYGFPCDIEWAREAGRFYIVQSRPITTLSNKPVNNTENRLTIKDFILEFEAEGLKPLFQELMFKSYYPPSSLMTFKDNVLRSLIHKKIWVKMGQEGLEIMSDEKNRTFENAISDIKRVKSDFKIGAGLTKQSLRKLLSDLKSAARSYGYFNMAYLEESHKHLGRNPILDQNLRKVEQLKDKIKEDFNQIFFTEDSHWNKLISVLSKKFSLEKSQLGFYLEKEIFDLFSGNKLPEQEINERKMAYVLKNDNQKEFLQGPEAEQFLSEFDKESIDRDSSIISGTVSNIACGIVKGRVKLISINYERFEETQIKINEMRKGDILVSRTTDPSLIQACKKASAIITDVGGMLSHAAITARELNIPGIIGTQIATKVLKDGDMVEVDADKGIIRLISGSNEAIPDFFRSLKRFATRPMTLQRDECGAMMIWHHKVRVVSIPVDAQTRAFYVETNDSERAYTEMLDTFRKPDNWKKHIGQYKEISARLLKAGEAASKCGGKADKTLLKTYKEWLEAFDGFSPYLFAPFAIEAKADPLCRKLLKEELGDGAESAFAVISTPSELNEFQKMRLELIDAVVSGKNNASNHKELADKYGWYNEYSWVEPLFGPEHFEAEMAKITKEEGIKERDRMRNDAENNRKAYSALMKRLKREETKTLAESIHTYTFLRTDRIEKMKRAQADIRPLYDAIARSLGKTTGQEWTRQMVVSCLNQELIDFLEHGTVPDICSIRKRTTQQYVYYVSDGKPRLIEEETLVRQACDIIHQGESGGDQIKGTITYRGKATGRVALVNNKKDLSKVKPGDVLVAKITMPDYTPAMHIACAFVTEEGGVTSHAAIIARELKKPCIVGTGNCTRLLKDGDVVEVDADAGVVRIIDNNPSQTEFISIRKRKIPLFTPAIYYFSPYSEERVGFDLGKGLMVIEDDTQQMLFSKKEFEQAGEYLLNQTIKDPLHLKKRLAQGSNIARKWIKNCKAELDPEKLKRRTDAEICELLARFIRTYEEYSCMNVPPWMYMGDKLFNHIKAEMKLPEDKLLILATPNTATYTRELEKMLLEIILECKQMIAAGDSIESAIADKKISQSINLLSERYFWIPFDYLGPEVWDRGHIIRELKKNLDLSLEEIKSKLKSIIEHPENLLKSQKTLIKEHQLTKGQTDLLEAIKDVATLQDDKKSVTTQAHYYLGNLMSEISRRSGIPKGLVYLLLANEIKEMLLDKKDFTEELARRRKICVGVVTSKSIRPYSGQEASDLLISMGLKLPSESDAGAKKSLQGQTGAPGKHTGTAKVLLSPRESAKLNQGDILVASMTTPDYVPLMKKAGAIITDEGGITCHAAIVSRELGIPCVIGTKNATQVIKDGDIVEVDANNGLVRILDRGQPERISTSSQNGSQDTPQYELTFKEFFPIFWDYQWVNKRYQESFGRIIGENPESISIYENGEVTKFWPKDLTKSLSRSLSGRMSAGWARKELARFEKDLQRFKESVDELSKSHPHLDWSGLSKKLREILAEIETINGYSNGFYFISIACEDKLRSELTKKGKTREETDSILLKASSQQLKPTVLTRYKTDIAQTAEELAREARLTAGQAKKLNDHELWATLLNKSKTAEAQLDNIHSKYGWFLSFTVDKMRDRESFIPDLLAAMRSEETAEKEVHAQDMPLELEPYLEVLRVSGYIKDEASSFTIPYMWYRLRNCWQKVMDHHNLDLDEFQQLTEDESLGGDAKPGELKQIAKRRKAFSVMKCNERTGVTILDGEEAHKIAESIQAKDAQGAAQEGTGEIKGMPANHGKAKGPVKVILKSSEIKDFQEGHVLVAMYTAPEFVPAMRKSIAIVTDTGGITSHAAILSRELDKPCVIGTKNATKVLKDGDMVEVDADRGAVRILNREGTECDAEILIERHGLKPATQRELPLFTLSCIGEAYTKLTKPLIGMSYRAVGAIGSRGHFHTLLNEQQVADDLNAVLNDEAKDIERDILGPLMAKSRESEKRIAKTRPLAENSPLDNLQKLADEYLTYLACLGSYNCFYRLIGDGKQQTRLTETQIIEIGKERDRLAKIYPEMEKSFAQATRKIGESHGFDGDLLRYITYDELRSKTDYHLSPVELSELSARREGYFYMIDSATGKEQVLTDPAMIGRIKTRHFLTDVKGIDTLHGTTGHGGKATGRAIVSINRSGKDPVRADGQTILVTPMTHPEDLPLIKRCAGIITDEGGILSHAAIIARELNKPCVIGTKIATQAIKDGDIVEVDADKGVVRISGRDGRGPIQKSIQAQLESSKEWFILNGACVPYIASYVVRQFSSGIHKRYPSYPFTSLVGIHPMKNGAEGHFILNRKEYVAAARYLFEHLDALDRLYSDFVKAEKLLTGFVKVLLKEDDACLHRNFGRFMELYDAEYMAAGPIDGFYVYGEQFIEEMKRKYPEKEEQITCLTSPYGKTFLAEHTEGILEIALFAKKFVADHSSFAALLKNPAILSRLESHQQAFFWIQNSYKDAQPLTVEFFAGRVYEMLKEDVKTLESNLNEVMGRVKSHQKECRNIESGGVLSKEDFTRLLWLGKMAWWIDRRKKFNLIGNYFIDRHLRYICKENKIVYDDALFLLPEELELVVSGKKKSSDYPLSDRKSECLHISDKEGQEIFLHGKESHELWLKTFPVLDTAGLREITGMTANKGRAKGVARVIMDPKKDEQFEKGDILVTGMTRPDFLSLMHKAAAFVTDEGGITSHAAIIARELNKPCVIGTKIATQAIKDGDMVEVDADAGVVRILKDITIDLEEAKQLSWTEWLERPYHPFMTTLNYKGVDQRYFEAAGLKGFGYIANLYQYPMIFKSEKLATSNRSALDSFMKTNTIFDLTKLLEHAHDQNLKEIQKINSSKLSPAEKLASLRELACMYFPFLWIVEPLESYYAEKTDSIVPKHIQGDVKKWVGDVSIPKKKNVYALMQESLKRDPIERVHKKFAWLKSRDGFTDFYTIKELEEIKRQSKEEHSVEVNIPKPLSGLAEEIKELTYFRTDRTDKYYEFLGLCRKTFMEVASAIGVPFKELANYDVESILAGKPKKIDIPYTFLYYKGRQIVMKERLIEVRSSSTSEVKGLIAFPGIARGIARIVKHPTEVSKLSRGEILVAQMTFPSFIAAMQKAAAFVTDEGGITCHAAIIAREMRKPCIVGTGNCTKALKDGDMVEVDADRGVVRTLNRNDISKRPEDILRSTAYIRVFELTGMPVLTSCITLEYYKSLGPVVIFRNGIWTAYLPKSTERKTIQQGLEMYRSKEAFTEFKCSFEEYMRSSSRFFRQTLSQKKITLPEAEKFLSLISEHWKYYMKTESFFVDEAFNKSKEDKVIAANLGEFESIKTAGRQHLNSIIFGSDSQLNRLISMISKQTGVPATELLNYSKGELLGALSGKRVSKETLRQRADSYAIVDMGGGYSILEGDQAKRFIAGFITEQMSGEMRGTVANKGKAKGRAKVLFYGPDTFDKIPEMIHSMENGSILVTETTSPEIMSACKKASAILTNQGGMLSHAAIVSRELGIPCIVGLENITHRVKDGDLVEVDADQGIVRIITPSKK